MRGKKDGVIGLYEVLTQQLKECGTRRGVVQGINVRGDDMRAIYSVVEVIYNSS